jgi:hypothetical protein
VPATSNPTANSSRGDLSSRGGRGSQEGSQGGRWVAGSPVARLADVADRIIMRYGLGSGLGIWSRRLLFQTMMTYPP